MSERRDAVVVGAGIVGLSVGYALAKEGLRVAVVEKDGIGAGASGIAHGVLSEAGPLFTGGINGILDRIGREYYPRFVAEVMTQSTVDPFYREVTGIALALDEEEASSFQDVIHALGDPPHQMRWASVEECREIEPRLTTDAAGGVVYLHQQVDGYRLSLALAEAIERRGGSIVSGEVTGLAYDGDSAVGVISEAGALPADVVVLAMGPWSRRIEEWTGRYLPVTPSHGEVLHVQLDGPPVDVPIITAKNGPILPRGDGAVMIGSIGGRTMAADGRTTPVDGNGKGGPAWEIASIPTSANLEHMIEAAARVMPALADATLLAHLAGARPGSPDGLAFLGRLDGFENIFLATGHGTKGVHQAPISGALLADLILRGETRADVPIELFSPNRFQRAPSAEARGAAE
jgi:glycine oxidase